jgi:hypothetical protein
MDREVYVNFEHRRGKGFLGRYQACGARVRFIARNNVGGIDVGDRDATGQA